VRLPGEHQQDDQDPGSRHCDLHRSMSDVSQDRLRHSSSPHGIEQIPNWLPVINGPKLGGNTIFLSFFALAVPSRTFTIRSQMDTLFGHHRTAVLYAGQGIRW
jgi:hypothetical protein